MSCLFLFWWGHDRFRGARVGDGVRERLAREHWLFDQPRCEPLDGVAFLGDDHRRALRRLGEQLQDVTRDVLVEYPRCVFAEHAPVD